MLLQVIVGALLGFVLFGAVVVLVLKRAPLLFVADKLPGSLYGGAEDVGDFVDGKIESQASERTDDAGTSGANDDTVGGSDREGTGFR